MSEYTVLRKQYYTAFDVPFCKCRGCWHYDKDLRGFVCEECGRPVPVIDITRHTRPLDVCKLCGAPITQVKNGRKREFCSDYCRLRYKDIKRGNVVNRDKIYDKHYIQQIRDSENRAKETNFNQDDNYWGLGESDLKEHMAKDFIQEAIYVRKEKERLKKWKQR